MGKVGPADRRHALRSDVDRATLGMAMLAVPMLLFAIADYLLVGLGTTFAVLLLLRLTFMGFTLATIWQLRRVSRPEAYDRIVALWSIVAIVSAFTMNAIRPPTHTLNLGIQALALLAMYLVIPSRQSIRLVMAVLVMALVTAMQLSGRRQVDLATTTLIWTTVLLTNAIGLTVAARFERPRRRQLLDRVEAA